MTHITESKFYGKRFTTPEMRLIFADETRYQRWLNIEAALALVQGELGVIPIEAAEEIAQKAKLENLDLERVKIDLELTSHSLVPLLREVQRVCRGGLGEYIHYGATTQDIQDTATMLEMLDAFRIIRRDVRAIAQTLTELATQHKETLMVGRSQGQYALTTTFGYRMAIWLDELLRHLKRMDEAEERIFVISLFGGVGNMSCLPRGIETMRMLAKRLHLNPANTSWHTARDRIAEFVMLLSMTASTLGKICNEIYVLSRTECSELAEPYTPGKLGSSTMPHKRNPEVSAQVVLLARMTKYNVAMSLEAMIAEDDRDLRSLRADWICIPEVCSYTAAAATLCGKLLKKLDICQDKMATNLKVQEDFIFSEQYMIALGEIIGKQSAHSVVYEASMQAYESGQPIINHLLKHPQVENHLSRSELEDIQSPANRIGAAKELTQAIIDQSNRYLEFVEKL